MPIIVKGIQRPEDVKIAKQHGANAVILSNHGGRQLDGSSPPIATLIRTREMYPELLTDEKFEVYIDGGIRRGTESVFTCVVSAHDADKLTPLLDSVLKALCLGAKGVGLGRAMIYAQACYGEEGVLRAMHSESLVLGSSRKQQRLITLLMTSHARRDKNWNDVAGRQDCQRFETFNG